ncbi:RTA1 like protein-domain-containing protein [Daldinia caldariorum]|uniref:RTA1 like protein-domain-containing protein n=1 Tax=Daldinia caldariorum TaxID=326644 RepID=UPI002007D6D8|nr:RTA1 like protein-domain-containing protein [Daldinia caldariorum]KAI1465799.1 RTA1 like protein-domain-containing protein [Daldinia caldariorum]
MRSIASCTFETCPVAASPYGYPPSAAAGVIFFIIHLGSFVACLVYSFYLAEMNRWLEFSIPISIGCLLESIGYAIRIGSASDPWDVSLYAASTAFIIIPPAFISAAIYLTIPEAIKILGAEHSPISVWRYIVLTWIDAAGFVFQFIGLVVSFSDISSDTGLGHNSRVGSPIIATGMAIQAISLLIHIGLFGVVLFRAAVANSQFGYTTFHPVHGYVPMAYRFKFFLAMLLLSAMCLFARALYQTVVLANGLGSWTAKNQALFAGLDSFLVAEAVVGLCVAHPVTFLRDGIEKRLGSRATNDMADEQRISQFMGNQFMESQYRQRSLTESRSVESPPIESTRVESPPVEIPPMENQHLDIQNRQSQYRASQHWNSQYRASQYKTDFITYGPDRGLN